MKDRFVWLALLALPALAQEAEASDEDWDRLAAQVRQLREEASRMRTAAQQAHAEAQQSCWKKFLVSACLEEARMALREKEREAKALEIEASRIERRIRRHEHEEKVARHAAQSAQRQMEAGQRAEETRRHEETLLHRRQEKAAEIERRKREAD